MKKPFTGIIAFIIVLLTMPLGHAAMILMEKGFGHERVYVAAVVLGFIGILFFVAGFLSKRETPATLWGLFAGLFVWTGWIEFAFVYYAHRFGVEPLIQNGQVVTKPEYLILPSTIGFWAIFMLYYTFGTRTGCRFFLWFQRILKLNKKFDIRKFPRNTALATFMEIIMVLWTFYIVLLVAYDPRFAGDRHPFTYFVAFASLLWSLILFVKLVKFNNLAYAIRYAIPTVIIFWDFVEILGRWGMFEEIWNEPTKYLLEIKLMLLVLFVLTVSVLFNKKLSKKTGSVLTDMPEKINL